MTREDLTHASQACQTAHVVADFYSQHPKLALEWAQESNSIIILTVPDEKALYAFCEKSGLDYTEFREPDLGYALTAVALHPCGEARKKTSNLPLAMKKEEHPDVKKNENKIKSMIRDMNECEQMTGMSVLEHGWSVRNHVRDLIGERSKFNWKLPEWLPEKFEFDNFILDKYTIFHDCGKPNCRTEDESGQHFYNHAEVSSVVWSTISDDLEIKNLIKRDMEIHTISAADLPDFCRDIDKAKLLCIVGLAELHSNASMFGGIESQSFKVKYKQWSRRAKQVFT